MDAKLRFSLADASGKVKVMDDATAVLGQDELLVNPVSGGSKHYSLRDVATVNASEYRIFIGLRSPESLMLFNLGSKFEDFARELIRSVNDLELRDILMDEKLLKQGVKGECSLTKEGGRTVLGSSEIRLYQTALVVMPAHSGLYRARFADIESVEVKNFKLSIRMENGDVIELGMLGRELDPLRKGIVDTSADLSAQVQRLVKDAYPGAGTEGVAKAAKLLKEGNAAGKEEIEGACPGLWQGLEKKVAGMGISEEYALLASLAKRGGVRVGMKRSLHSEGEGDGAKDYVFLLAPIYSTDKSQGGNAVAFEASSGEDEGRATYFFRIWGRKEYPQGSIEDMDREAAAFVASMATGLNAINFRREPIYLGDDKLYSPENSRYRYAIMRIPELRLLRERLIGRVMHTSPEEWKEDVKALLAFNVEQTDDTVRWVKPVEQTEEQK